MKTMLLFILISVSIFGKSLEKEVKFVKYKVKVLDFTQQLILEYSKDKNVGGIYASKHQFSSYMRVCVLLNYSDVIETGYRDDKSALDTVEMLFDTKFLKCLKRVK